MTIEINLTADDALSYLREIVEDLDDTDLSYVWEWDVSDGLGTGNNVGHVKVTP
jgi:hypothetical protein